MSLRPYNLTVLALLLLSSLGLATWWIIQLQPLSSLSWKTLPPDIPVVPRFDNAPTATNNQSLSRPLFWESRRPMPPQAPTSQATGVPAPMELLGVVTEGSRRIALVRTLKGTPPLPVQRLHLGETFNGMSLQAINEDNIVLKGSNGSQTLKILRGSQGAPRETLVRAVKQTDTDTANTPPPERSKSVLSAEERTKLGSDELKKHIENLKRRAAE